MVHDIQSFQALSAKWQKSIQAAIVFIPPAFFIGIAAGFYGAKKKVIQADTYIQSISTSDSGLGLLQSNSKAAISLLFAWVILFFINNILKEFAKGNFFTQTTFRNIKLIGNLTVIFSSMIFPLILTINFWILSADVSFYDLLFTFVSGFNWIGIIVGTFVLLMGKALLMAKNFYDEQQLTI